MGTLLNRRRYMGGAKEQGYIQDGLVFWLDGIDKGTADTDKWVDLINGVTFGNPQGVTWNENRFATTQNFCFPLTSGEIPWGDGYTFELAFNNTGTKANVFVLFQKASDSNAFHIYFNSAKIRWKKGEKPWTFASAIRGSYRTLGFNSARCYVNGLERTAESSADTYGPTVSTACLGHPNDSTMPGYLYAIRIYNRTLSADEIIANQRIDNIRFNLGLTI